METKGLEEMTKKGLINLIVSLNKELEEVKKQSETRRGLWLRSESDLSVEKKKLSALKEMISVL